MNQLKRHGGRIDVSGWQIPALDAVKEAVEDAYTDIINEAFERLLRSDDMIISFDADEPDTLTLSFCDLDGDGGDVTFTGSLTAIVDDAISYDEGDPGAIIPLRNLFRELTEKLNQAAAGASNGPTPEQ